MCVSNRCFLYQDEQSGRQPSHTSTEDRLNLIIPAKYAEVHTERGGGVYDVSQCCDVLQCLCVFCEAVR